MIKALFVCHGKGVVREVYHGISSQSGGITFPFPNRDYGNTTNVERKTTDITVIVKAVGAIVTK